MESKRDTASQLPAPTEPDIAASIWGAKVTLIRTKTNIRVEFLKARPLKQRHNMLHLRIVKKPAFLRHPVLGLVFCVALVSFITCANAGASKSGRWEPVYRVDKLGVDQVRVPSGTFLRGTKDISTLNPPKWVLPILASEQPQHTVHITHAYWIDKFEVSNAAFAQFVEAGGYKNSDYWSTSGFAWLGTRNIQELPVQCEHEERPDFPRMCITWFEAEAYATWRGGRLPTEAEWEYTARGPSSLIYPWGNDFDPTLANVIDSTGPVPVGTYPGGVSWVGAFEMSGNAMEWVQDWLALDTYKLRDAIDPQGPDSGKRKVEKGGWWGSNAVVARSAYHHFEDPPQYQDHHIGFRVLTPDDQQRINN